MKKIALCSLAVFVCAGTAYAANMCKTSLTFSPDNNNWNAGSDEYLFETKRDYLNAVNSGYFYECDSSWCQHNSYVKLKSGHVFGNRTIHEDAIYKCSTSWNNDKWERVESTAGLTECTKLAYWGSDHGLDKAFQNLSADEYLYPTVQDYDALKSRVSSQVYECDSSVCADGTIIVLPAGHVFERNEIGKQRKYKCVLGDPGNDKWVDITDDCEDCAEKEDPVKPTPKPDPKPKPKPAPQPEPQPEVDEDCYYEFSIDIQCDNGSKKFSKGQRIPLTKEQAAKLGGCNSANAQIRSIEEEIERTKKEYNAAAELMELICGSRYSVVKPVVVGPSNSQLSDATRTLELFASSASSEASVWKDADGKFNTARLASDLTAGVVLGTVGGVVSGVVIKKKQVEKGFDALHCTVGGQKVADWGDTFKVGLQK